MRRSASRSPFLAALLVLAASLVAVAPPIAQPAVAAASAGSSAEERSHEAAFVARINDLRRSRGLGPLASDPELTAQARRWTDTMAADGHLRHASDLSVGVSADWTVLGENVGVHTVHDIDRLFQAFVDSPSHLANLTDARYNRVGVGVVHAPDGRIWTTHRFMATPTPSPPAPVAPAAAAPPPPPPPPATAAPTTPPTTAPPTTAPPPTTTPPPPPPPSPTPPTPPAPTTPAPTASPATNAGTSRPTAQPTPVATTGAAPTSALAAERSANTGSSSGQRSGGDRMATSSPSPTATTGVQAIASPPRSARSTEARADALAADEPVVTRLAEILSEVDASGL